jgi:hypothetical protein
MRQVKTNQLQFVFVALSGFLLSGCNGGSSNNGTTSGNTVSTNSNQTREAATTDPSRCLNGTVSFNSDSVGNTSGVVNIINSCANAVALSGQVISLTSQDTAGNLAALGTLTNSSVNSVVYTVTFTSGSDNTQFGTFSSSDGSTTIEAGQSIIFGGEINLPGKTSYDSGLATKSFLQL